MKALTATATAVGDGLVAGFLGTAAMTVSSTIEARLRHRAASTAPARATAKATAAHGAAVWGSAAVTLPALDVAPPFVFWGRKEVAIDLLHHAVYAVATGLAYEVVAGGRRNGSG